MDQGKISTELHYHDKDETELEATKQAQEVPKETNLRKL